MADWAIFLDTETNLPLYKMAELEAAVLAAAHIPVTTPKISIITPTWNTKPEWFADLALSILGQTFHQWEWCIVDDRSSVTDFHDYFPILGRLANIKIERGSRSRGISEATNSGLRKASGIFVCCVDHDDILPAEALLRCAETLNGPYDAVYTDSDKMDEEGRRSEPFHKPDWSPEYFRGVMYVGHLLCVRRAIANQIGGFSSRFDGVQDFEFFLRFAEQTNQIAHIPEILYHWRTVPGSVAANTDAKGNLEHLQCLAVQEHLQRQKFSASAQPGAYPHRVRVTPNARTTWPRVSIVIPTKDNPDVLHQCLFSLFARTTYPNFEVFCVDNDTSDPRALQEMCNAPVERLLMPGKFNYSKANNLAAAYATGDYLVFMNNDIEILQSDWIEQMLYYAEQEDVGAVGPLLLFPDGTVQHAGVVLGCRGTADHVFRSLPADCDGYAGSISCAHETSAATAACLMVPRFLYLEVGCFNEHYFTHYQDVDLCCKIRQRGKRIIFTPHARFIHHESKSRGGYYDLVDRNLLLDLWEPVIKKGDPYYNPNFNLQRLDYSLA